MLIHRPTVAITYIFERFCRSNGNPVSYECDSIDPVGNLWNYMKKLSGAEKWAKEASPTAKLSLD